MSVDASADQDADDSDLEFAEIDPTDRYGRYKEVLGKGAFKTVYRAFDELEGIEVAWNQIKIADVLRSSDDLERLHSEVHLLKTLKHKNIIKFYSSWVDTKHGNVNIITEIFTSGTLRQYRKKHKRVDLRALKNWSKQILRGLLYLHSHDPPVIHRDLKCDNIFVNGNQGEVKIGDLGLAAILKQAHAAHSVIGTPEFMAPELYEEEYNELVDIYAFGMCLLELVTFEYPYIECANAAQIYKKVTMGIKPASLEKVKDPEVKEFIEKCIANVSERLPARELLMDPFLQSDSENESVGRSSRPEVARSVNSSKESISSEEPSLHDNMPNLEISETLIGSPSHSKTLDAEYSGHQPDKGDGPLSQSGGSRDFTVEGQRKDVHTIFLKLCIADSKGHVRNIQFPFDIDADTALGVASEMVTELDLTDQDVTTIAAMIDSEIQAHVPEWAPGESVANNFPDETRVSENQDSEINDDVCLLSNDPDQPPGQLVLERLPSGRKYWSDSPKQISEGSPARSARSNLSSRLDTCIDDSCSPVRELADSQIDQNKEVDSPNDIVSSHHQGDSASTHESEDIQSADFEQESTSSSGLQEKHIVDNDNLQLNCDKKGSAAELYHDQSVSGSSAESSLEDSRKTSMEIESQGMEIIARKLEHLLGEQQKELDKLKRKHQLEIRELLKELPPELRSRTVNMCLWKAPDCNIQNEVYSNVIACLNVSLDEPYFNTNSACSREPNYGSDEIDVGTRSMNDNAKDNGFLVGASSGETRETFVSEGEQIAKCDLSDSFTTQTAEDHHHPKGADLARNHSFGWIFGKGGKRDSIIENHASALKDKSNLFKGSVKSSDVGIAVILGDNLAKSVTEGESM